MTFSIIARDATGAFGMAVSSSSPSVAARCLHLRARIGAVASQNITDPRLGKQLLERLELGESAQDALHWLLKSNPTMPYRQISLISTTGNGVVHSGEKVLGTFAEGTITDTEGGSAVAAGNMLANTGVIDAMLQSFAQSNGQLESRLYSALNSGLAAGGEQGEVHSAGLAVVRQSDWNETDLRLDWSATPISDLGALLDLWLPQRDAYITRGISPSLAPTYGVPGDE